MFPFNLPGPQFLVFYAVFAAVLILFYRFYAMSGSAGDKIRLSQLTDDPYQIAFLRGGAEEAVRVAIVNLVDRKLLEVAIAGVKAAAGDGAALVRRKLDVAILKSCEYWVNARNIWREPAVRAACMEYEAKLSARGLLLSASERSSRAFLKGVVLVLLGGVALARLAQAFSRGQGNIFFLIVLAVIALVIAWCIVGGYATATGREALKSLQILMQRVQRQVSKLQAGGTTNEALMLAAVMGIHALPAAAFPFVSALFPTPMQTAAAGNRDRSSSCGSSSSCSSSSSCGGGGGGCGGCGGGD